MKVVMETEAERGGRTWRVSSGGSKPGKSLEEDMNGC